MSAPRASFYDLTRPELLAWVARAGLPARHAAKLWGWVHRLGVTDWGAMDDLPARFRARLEEGFDLARPAVARAHASADGFTRKYLLALADDRRIETVLMRHTGRVTACVSSQAGCAMGCVFCATGQAGFGRHLTAGEIVTQALHVDGALRVAAAAGEPAPGRREGASPHARHERLRNLVLMGMGEPLHNYDAVLRAVEILTEPSGLALGRRRITRSPVGVVPGIRRLTAEARPVHLAVSLHGATQEERAALVPVARRWPLDELLAACRDYTARHDRSIFYEWTLVAGRNDTPEQARALGRLLRGHRAHVNLIPLNLTAGYDGAPTGREAARRFQAILAEHGLPSTVRQRRGLDIAAGCGQLAGPGE